MIVIGIKHFFLTQAQQKEYNCNSTFYFIFILFSLESSSLRRNTKTMFKNIPFVFDLNV